MKAKNYATIKAISLILLLSFICFDYAGYSAKSKTVAGQISRSHEIKNDLQFITFFVNGLQ